MLNTYRVRLNSQTDDQWREVLLQAEHDLAAERMAARSEQAMVDFSLLRPALAEADGVVVDQRRLNSDAYALGERFDSERLARLREDHCTTKSGKIDGPTARGRAHLHAHEQKVPYRVASVEIVRPHITSLVEQLREAQQNADDWQAVLGALRELGVPLAATATLFGLTALKNISGSSPSVWGTGTTHKVALAVAAWAPNPDLMDFFNDVGANEVTGTNYTAGGAVITSASKTAVYDSATDQVRLAGPASTSWANLTATARYAPIYEDTAGASSTDPLWGYIDFGSDVAVTAAVLQINWDPTGIINYDLT